MLSARLKWLPETMLDTERAESMLQSIGAVGCAIGKQVSDLMHQALFACRDNVRRFPWQPAVEPAAQALFDANRKA
jgi:hypothetical protein